MIAGTRVGLRPARREDLPLFETWAEEADDQAAHYRFGLQPATGVEAQFERHGFLTDERGRLIVIERTSGEAVGYVSYHLVGYGPNQGSRAYNIGIHISPAHRHHGYGSEAQYLLAAYLLSTYPVMRIEASTDVDNVAEQRALESAGFRREGVLRQAQWRAGAWHDLVLYSKLRGE